jgi:hypothetical protein
MSVHVSGTITAPAENRGHNEPFHAIPAGSFASGSTATVAIGKFTNTGNITQTVTTSLINLINCVQTDLKFTDDAGVESLDSVTLSPGVGANLVVHAKLPDEAIGSPDVNFSFDVESVWA